MISRMNIDNMRIAAALLLLLGAINCAAETVYRWQDESGAYHYSDLRPETRQPVKRLELQLPSPLYAVEKVIDGDTIVVKSAGKVRLLGINAPEVAHRDRRGEPFGDEAKQRLEQLLNAEKVYLYFDQQRRDRFGRLLAHVVREDGRNVNEQLLEEGLARALFLQPNIRQLEHYFAIEAGAQKAGRGIWSLKSYQVRPATSAADCIKRFCQLHGQIRRIEAGRHYIYLHLPGRLRVAIHLAQRSQFEAAGIDIHKLKGMQVTVRGWVGTRQGAPYLRLQHPQQIKINPT